VNHRQMPRTGRASLTRSTCYRQTLAQVIESWDGAYVVACVIGIVNCEVIIRGSSTS
jgi:hypothetical protein